MSTTAWERRKAISDRIRAVWDAKRDGRDWKAVYEEAQAHVAQQLEWDALTVRHISWDEFRRLQGWHDPVDGQKAGQR